MNLTTAEYNRIMASRNAPPKPRAKRFTGARSAAKQNSRIQQAFEAAYDGPELTPEYRFHPTRRWRMDLAHVETKVAVEFHGQVWRNGRHTRGSGFLADREKMNTAQELGWIVFELGDERTAPEWARRVKQAIEQRAAKE